MIPYYMLTRDHKHFDQLARDLNRYSRTNTHTPNRAPVNRSTVSVSEMISSGTLHAFNAAERGWNKVASLFG